PHTVPQAQADHEQLVAGNTQSADPPGAHLDLVHHFTLFQIDYLDDRPGDVGDVEPIAHAVEGWPPRATARLALAANRNGVQSLPRVHSDDEDRLIGVDEPALGRDEAQAAHAVPGECGRAYAFATGQVDDVNPPRRGHTRLAICHSHTGGQF